MEIGEKIEKMESELVALRLRIQATEFKLSETERTLRGEQAENIIRSYLNGLGMHIAPREKTCQDMVAVAPSTKRRVPIQVKSVSLEKHGYEIQIDDEPLREFEGHYIILIEHEPGDIILHIWSGLMQRLMREKGKMTPGKARHHKDYWSLYVPADLKGFEQYQTDEHLKEEVFGRNKDY